MSEEQHITQYIFQIFDFTIYIMYGVSVVRRETEEKTQDILTMTEIIKDYDRDLLLLSGLKGGICCHLLAEMLFNHCNAYSCVHLITLSSALNGSTRSQLFDQ